MALYKIQKKINVLGLKITDLRFSPVYFKAESPDEYKRHLPKSGRYTIKEIQLVRLPMLKERFGHE